MVPATGGPGPAGGTPGYNRLPQETARRFLPYGETAAGLRAGTGQEPRLYRTGDLVRGAAECAAGVHLEASPQNIAECAGTVPVRGPGYRTLCDPRLNMRQAVAVAAHWQQGLSPARPAVRAANP